MKELNAAEARSHIPILSEILVDCVDGGASVSFMHPLPLERATIFWETVVAAVERGERALLVAVDDSATGGAILGTAQLVLSLPENQPHRADVAKVLVRRSARNRGVGMHLMAMIDTVAIKYKRSVLVLDTVAGGDGERLYQRAGWTRVGEIPKFALAPSGDYCATTYYYKHL